MYQIAIEDIKEDMILGKSIYSSTGDLLLAAGYKLRDKYIQKLKTMGYSSVWIQEKGIEHIVPEEMISEQLALQTNKAVRENSEIIKKVAQVKGQTKEDIDKSMSDTSKFKNVIVIKKVKEAVTSIIDSILASQDVLINISSIRNKDNYLYSHNVDVTVMSLMLGKILQLNKLEMEEMAIGAIMHDLGMVVIPDHIQKKGRRLNFQEFTILKEHTTYGYNILKENPRISPVSSHIAYQHHERQDGGGYPRGLKGTNALPNKRNFLSAKGCMHRYAEIVAVANTYDNLIAPHNMSEAKAPDEAIRILIRAAGTQLNKHVVDTFVNMTPSFPVGALVSIVKGPPDIIGFKGVVSKNFKENLSKPEVTLIYNKDKKRIKPFKINLAERDDVNVMFYLKN